MKLGELWRSLIHYNITFKSENLNKELIDQILQTSSNIKEYIKASKDCKNKLSLLQTRQTTEAIFSKEQSMLFMTSDAKQLLTELINNFRMPFDSLTNAELIQLKKDLSSKVKIINKIAKKYLYLFYKLA